MQNLSYNLSPELKGSLQKIDYLRQQILLTPVAPKTELRLRWEAMLNRVYWALSLASSDPPKKKEIVKLFTAQVKKKPTRGEQELINYKKALDYISQEWLVSRKDITVRTVLTLHEIASSGQFRSSTKESLGKVLDYLQTSPENPVIRAGIAQIQLLKIAPFTEENEHVSRLLALLFLYKYGYDFRGFLVLEEYWRRDLISFRDITQRSLEDRNLTSWLEYFTQGMATQLEKVAQDTTSPSFKIDVPSAFWELNDRQKTILSLFEQPQMTITNKKVQDLFKVSQVTASRDLTKLVALGFLFAHGKGRSVYYTKV